MYVQFSLSECQTANLSRELSKYNLISQDVLWGSEYSLLIYCSWMTKFCLVKRFWFNHQLCSNNKKNQLNIFRYYEVQNLSNHSPWLWPWAQAPFSSWLCMETCQQTFSPFLFTFCIQAQSQINPRVFSAIEETWAVWDKVNTHRFPVRWLWTERLSFNKILNRRKHTVLMPENNKRLD